MGQPSEPGSWPSPEQPMPTSGPPEAVPADDADGGASRPLFPSPDQPPSSWSAPPGPSAWDAGQQPAQQPPAQQQVPQQPTPPTWTPPPVPAPAGPGAAQPWGNPSGQQQPAMLPVPPAPPVNQPGYGQPTGQSMYGVRPQQPGPGPQQGGYGQFTFPVAPRQPLEPLAVAGVATSVLGPVGVILGLLARGRIKRTRRRSMGLAWTAVALGAVFTLTWGMVAGVLASNGTLDQAFQEPEPGDAAEPRTVAAVNLATGNCVATLPPAEQVGEVRVVPCATDHIAQVVSEHELSGAFPGATALATEATATCTAEVEQIDAGDAAIQPWYLVPSESGWEQGNTRLVCLLRGSAGPLTVDLVNT